MGLNGELVFVGCYTDESDGSGDGVVCLRRDQATGVLTHRAVVARTPSPSFLARHPSLPVLYAVNELAEGTVSSWAVTPDGALTPLAVRSTGGAHPCHLATTADGGHLLVANHGSGSVAVLPLGRDGVPGERTDVLQHHGRGPVADRQDGPHAHMTVPGLGAEVLAVDLGADRVFRYRLDAAGRLTDDGAALIPAPGTGPRHLVRHPDGTIYLVGELAGTVTGYRPDPADGRLREVCSSPVSTGPVPVYPSEVVLGADGRFLYVGNRGPDTVTVFAVGSGDGTAIRVAELSTGGTWPRHLALAGHHLYVANERSHNVSIFEVDGASGVPRPVGESAAVPSPTCVLRWSPAASLI